MRPKKTTNFISKVSQPQISLKGFIQTLTTHAAEPNKEMSLILDLITQVLVLDNFTYMEKHI